MLIGGLLFLQAGSPICCVRFLCFCLKKGSHVANMRNADPAIIIAELMMWAKKNKKTVHYYWAQGRNPKELFLLKRDLRPFAAEYSTHSFEPNNSKTAIIFRFFFSVFLMVFFSLVIFFCCCCFIGIFGLRRTTFSQQLSCVSLRTALWETANCRRVHIIICTLMVNVLYCSI